MITSIENRNLAYYNVLDSLSDKRKRVFKAIEKLGKATAQEVAEHLKLPINEVTGRITELRNLQAIQICGSVLNRYTNKPNTQYQIKETLL